MATGDQADVVARLRAQLPFGWFPDTAPILSALLNGFAYGLSRAYGLLAFVKAQGRITTASGVWLDGVALDFFGTRLARMVGELDGPWAFRIKREIVRPRNTRAAIIEVVTDLTGRAPLIVEPAYPMDTGGYDVGGIGYNVAGAYGDMQLPFQVFVTAYRPHLAGNVGGGGYGSAIGYGIGGAGYINLKAIIGGVSDANIYAAIASVMPASSIAWTTILS